MNVKINKAIRKLFSRGLHEMRNARLLSASSYFDEDWYARRYPDTRDMPAVLHYLRYGADEGRDPSPHFSTSSYVVKHPDVQRLGINPLVHYLRHGHRESGIEMDESLIAEGRREDVRLLKESGLFDAGWYQRTYASELKGRDPYMDFVTIGDLQGRQTGTSFNPKWYATQYLDVSTSGRGPLMHYLHKGRAEGRAIGLTPSQRAAILETVQDVEPLDPEFQACRQVHEDPDTLRTNHFYTPLYLTNAWSAIFSQLRPEVRLVVFASGLRATCDHEDDAPYYVRAAADRYGAGSVLVFLTDGAYNGPFAATAAEGVQVLALKTFYEEASLEERTRVVEALIFSILPAAVLNLGSEACWDAVARRGKALSSFTDIYCRFSSRDFDPLLDRPNVARTHFRRCIACVARMYVPQSDDKAYLVKAYGTTAGMEKKIQVVPVVGTAAPSADDWERFLSAIQVSPSFLLERAV